MFLDLHHAFILDRQGWRQAQGYKYEEEECGNSQIYETVKTLLQDWPLTVNHLNQHQSANIWGGIFRRVRIVEIEIP